MAYFAKINENNIVEEIAVISNCAIGSCIGPDHWDYQEEYHKDHGTLEFPDTEPLGQQVLAESGFEGTWKQTSYNATFRGKYAGSGDIYDPILDVFTSPQIETEEP
jgi:hypothetical protein